MRVITALILLAVLVACGPSREEIEARDRQLILANAKNNKGRVVYIKPDSLKGVITKIVIANWPDSTVYFEVRTAQGQLMLEESDFFKTETTE